MNYWSKKRIILLAIVIFIIGCGLGLFAGVYIQKGLMDASAAGFWMRGVTALEKDAYDHALVNFIQAVALKNDEPVFLRSVAEVYEKKNNKELAIEFYKLALEIYKKEKYGPIKQLEQKINQLGGTGGTPVKK